MLIYLYVSAFIVKENLNKCVKAYEWRQLLETYGRSVFFMI